MRSLRTLLHGAAILLAGMLAAWLAGQMIVGKDGLFSLPGICFAVGLLALPLFIIPRD